MNAIEKAAEAVLDYCSTEPYWSTGKAASIIKRELEKAVPALAKALGEHYVGTDLPADEFDCCEQVIRKTLLGE